VKEPEVDKVLTSFSGTLLTKIMPQLKSEYAQKDLTLIALELNAAAEEYDRAAENRMTENRAMRALFAEALQLLDDGELRAALADAVETEPNSLRIRDLNAANAALSEVLIRLHAHAEEQAGLAWRELEASIWTELKARTQRRAIAFFPF
jgi:Pyruvate/2-oxoacid:ferredoxin oxidoreductase gamma subunit